MLEHTLRQERSERDGNFTGGGEKPFAPSGEEQAADAVQYNVPSVGGKKIKEGRQILFQYLLEMGYTDSVIHAQAQRLKVGTSLSAPFCFVHLYFLCWALYCVVGMAWHGLTWLKSIWWIVWRVPFFACWVRLHYLGIVASPCTGDVCK
jgi:hypothetical protein